MCNYNSVIIAGSPPERKGQSPGALRGAGRRPRWAGLVAVAGAYENPLLTFYGASVMHRLFPVARAIVRAMLELLTPVWATMRFTRYGHAAARLIRAIGPNATAEALEPYLLHLASRDPAVMIEAVAGMRDHSAADLLDTHEDLGRTAHCPTGRARVE
ncbi:hypothetical protein BH24ACT3_BH24ACT3_03590 [soil metagenome]